MLLTVSQLVNQLILSFLLSKKYLGIFSFGVEKIQRCIHLHFTASLMFYSHLYIRALEMNEVTTQSTISIWWSKTFHPILFSTGFSTSHFLLSNQHTDHKSSFQVLLPKKQTWKWQTRFQKSMENLQKIPITQMSLLTYTT